VTELLFVRMNSIWTTKWICHKIFYCGISDGGDSYHLMCTECSM